MRPLFLISEAVINRYPSEQVKSAQFCALFSVTAKLRICEIHIIILLNLLLDNLLLHTQEGRENDEKDSEVEFRLHDRISPVFR